MIHLRHPVTEQLCSGVIHGLTPAGYTTTTDPVQARNFFPDDVKRIRAITGVEWIAVPLPATKEPGPLRAVPR